MKILVQVTILLLSLGQPIAAQSPSITTSEISSESVKSNLPELFKTYFSKETYAHSFPPNASPCGSNYDIVTIRSYSNIYIINELSCKSYGDSEKLYEGIYRGKRIWIPESKMPLGDQLTRIKQLVGDDRATFESSAIKQSLAEENNRKFDLVKAIARYQKKGLIILKGQGFKESEHTSGLGYHFKFFNPTKKVIKYLHISVVGLNQVEDPVHERGTAVKTIRGVGPIEAMGIGESSWNYVWFSDLVAITTIKQIKIEYMDKSVHIIKDPQSLFPSQYLHELFEDFFE